MSAVILSGWLGVARAEFTVTGEGDRLRVQATDARVEDVIATLRDKYGLIYHNESPLDQTITGTYSGSLDRVVKQIMRRYDHAIKSRDGTVELLVTNQVKSTAAAPALTPAPGPAPVSSVTSALQMQASQLAATNVPQGSSAGASSRGSGSGSTSSSAIIGAGIGNSGSAASGSGSSSPTSGSNTASMAELTQRASGTVRELTQALSRITP